MHTSPERMFLCDMCVYINNELETGERNDET